ncbi:thiamine phosphate synthase [Providencia rettgeri]|uniref:thiamine phosphate synthase n=1 Tax=Providencia TaxID=586 RepID=UPI0013DF1DE6|nr:MULTISPECIES: thiamine phosphate synthase [Providencia]MBW3106592.1 thiamine phosphate synthase [Providencia rettgeri]
MPKLPSAISIPNTIAIPNNPFPATEQRLGLYPVVDSVEWIERLLNAGVSTIQLRIKDKSDADVRDDIQQAIALGKKHNARLFINDYWRLAVELGAYGVHLGQEDLETTDLLAIHQAGLRLGISTHDEHELAIAKSVRPSYIAMGHIFPTQTKEMPSSPQGLETLKTMVEATPDYPTVAIGGISIDKVPAVLATGVGSVALVSAITKADDWRAATETLLDLIERNTAN